MIELTPWSHSFLPDLIKGDFDSLREDVKDYYVSRVSPTPLLPIALPDRHRASLPLTMKINIRLIS